MNIEKAIPFFWVMDIAQSLHFYVDQLGFKLMGKWVDNGKLRWCMVQREGANLMLQEFWKEGHHANLPKGQPGEVVSICLICRDALALYHEFRSQNAPASRPFVGNAMWVTGLKDPDGYDLYFESETDVPEETEYKEGE